MLPVLRPEGVLIFKWCEDEIPVSQILAMTRSARPGTEAESSRKHWVTLAMKPRLN